MLIVSQECGASEAGRRISEEEFYAADKAVPHDAA